MSRLRARRHLRLLAVAAVLATAPAAAGAAPIITPQVTGSRPHDASSFTEGLVWRGGRLLESGGQYGDSRLQESDAVTGRVLRRVRLPARYFAEGLAAWRGLLVQLTWRERTAFSWDAATFAPRGRFRYAGEGWGLTTLGDRLVMSDGSAVLRFIDPRTHRVVRRLRVTDTGPIGQLNELEVVDGLIWANQWTTDEILVVDPRRGRVRARLDMSGLRSMLPPGGRPEVLNGIAWERTTGEVLVTGKWWPRIFSVRVPAGLRSG